MFDCGNWQGKELLKSVWDSKLHERPGVNDTHSYCRAKGARGNRRKGCTNAIALLRYTIVLFAVLWELQGADCRSFDGLSFDSLVPGIDSPHQLSNKAKTLYLITQQQHGHSYRSRGLHLGESAKPNQHGTQNDGEANTLGRGLHHGEPKLIERWHPMHTWRCNDFWAREKLHHICVRRIYPWIECVRRSDATAAEQHPLTPLASGLTTASQHASDIAALGLQYLCASGRNGMVIWIQIINDPATFHIEVYRNMPEHKRGLDVSEQYRVKPEVHPRIDALMKLVNPEAEKTNRLLSLDKKKTLLEKETSRGRAMATSVELVPGVPLAPAWYDIVEVGKKQQHQVAESAFFFEKFNGITSSDALHLIVSSETLSLKIGVMRLVRYDMLKLDSPQPSAGWNLLDRVFDSVVLWSRQRLSLLDSLLALTESLNVGHGLSHCDLHMNNIMILESSPWGNNGPPPITDFLRFMHGGAFISLPLRFLVGGDADGLNDASFHTAWQKEVQKGFAVYDLHLGNLRVIDTSHTLNVSSMVKYIKGGTKRTVMIPCRMDRGTSEDILEMLRAVDMCLLLETARQNLREAAPLLDRWRSLVSSSQQEFPAAFRKLEDNVLVQKERLQFETSLQSLDTFFATLHRDILNLPGVKECNEMQNEFNGLLKKLQPQDVVKRFFSGNFTERVYWWNTLHHHCSVQSAEDGVTSARRLIAKRVGILKEQLFSNRIRGVYDVFLNEPYRNPRKGV